MGEKDNNSDKNQSIEKSIIMDIQHQQGESNHNNPAVLRLPTVPPSHCPDINKDDSAVVAAAAANNQQVVEELVHSLLLLDTGSGTTFGRIITPPTTTLLSEEGGGAAVPDPSPSSATSNGDYDVPPFSSIVESSFLSATTTQRPLSPLSSPDKPPPHTADPLPRQGDDADQKQDDDDEHQPQSEPPPAYDPTTNNKEEFAVFFNRGLALWETQRREWLRPALLPRHSEEGITTTTMAVAVAADAMSGGGGGTAAAAAVGAQRHPQPPEPVDRPPAPPDDDDHQYHQHQQHPEPERHAIELDVDDIIETLFASARPTCTDQQTYFTMSIPLPQMIDILQDLWEAEGLET
jgi:Protein of unknown function (DUF4050)